MKDRIAAAVLAGLVLWSSPALAWDPTRDDDRSDSAQPETDHSDPTPFIAPPSDIYYVTDTYAGEVVTSNGPVTTYSTETVHESTGSYARVLDVVGTGVSSPYDGSAFNGRRVLADGRLVAGTYYQNYILGPDRFVPVSIVFFQDDAEIARLAQPTTAPRGSAPAPAIPGASPTQPVSPACCFAPRPIVAAPSPSPIPARPVRPGISLLPASAPLASVEILRGRLVNLYPRAFVDDREIAVRSWSVIGGDAGEPLVTAGIGLVPFRSSWRRLAPPGSAYQVVFRIEVDTPETGHRTVDSTIAVVVRSPALED